MDKLGIINKAFLKLGQAPIDSLDNKDNKTVCALALYDSVRDVEQTSFRWTFCTKRFILEPLALTSPDGLETVIVKPAFGYKYQYLLPKGFLRLISIVGARQMGYSIEGNCLLIDNEGPLHIVALCVEQCENKFPPAFVEVFATKLAIELCKRLEQDNRTKMDLKQDYDYALMIAKKTDAIQRAVIPAPDGPWIEDRANTF